jgi:hypothetical protein
LFIYTVYGTVINSRYTCIFFWKIFIHIEPLCTGKRDLEVFLTSFLLLQTRRRSIAQCTMRGRDRGEEGGTVGKGGKGQKAEMQTALSVSGSVCISC